MADLSLFLPKKWKRYGQTPESLLVIMRETVLVERNRFYEALEDLQAVLLGGDSIEALKANTALSAAIDRLHNACMATSKVQSVTNDLNQTDVLDAMRIILDRALASVDMSKDINPQVVFEMMESEMDQQYNVPGLIGTDRTPDDDVRDMDDCVPYFEPSTNGKIA